MKPTKETKETKEKIGKISFIWKYITNSHFRYWCDFYSAQKYVDDMRRMFEENQYRQLNKIYDR